jgi:RNA polymerase-binding protein
VIVLGPDTRPDRRHYRPEPPVPRQIAAYRCDRGHSFEVPFAAGAELPQAVDCRCGASAHRGGTASVAPVSNAEAEHDRRTPAERQAALAERVAEVAAARKAAQP